MSGLAVESKLGISPAVSWVRVDAEVVVVGADDAVHLLPEPAATIFTSLDGRSTVHEIEADAVAVFGHASEAVAGDVRGFLTELVRLGLAVEAGSDATR